MWSFRKEMKRYIFMVMLPAITMAPGFFPNIAKTVLYVLHLNSAPLRCLHTELYEIASIFQLISVRTCERLPAGILKYMYL